MKILLLVLVLSTSLLGQKFSVSVDVSLKDVDSKNSLKSYLSRELRSLGDVEITEASTARYKVRVVAILSSSKGGSNLGYAYSSTFLESVECSYPGGTQKWECSEYLGNYLAIGDMESIQKNASSIIVDFDTAVLEPVRKLRRSTKE
ncbi:MAG: hypothetical protein ABL984_06895 [Pyrinomonadaceae bacterium]